MEDVIIILSTGKETALYHNGKVYGNGVVEIGFNHKSKELARLKVETVMRSDVGNDSFKEFAESVMAAIRAENNPK